MSCTETRGLFAAYLDERLTREERSSVREHLAGCDACRREASADDPAFLFSGLAGDDPAISAADTAKILEAVRTGIGLKSAERRIRDSRRRRGRSWARPAMTSAAAVAAAVLAWTFAPRPDLSRPASASRAPNLSAAVVRPPAPAAAASRPAPIAPGPFAPVLPGDGLEPANVKRNLPGDATIYDWNPGGGQPRVVWIVDRSLDI